MTAYPASCQNEQSMQDGYKKGVGNNKQHLVLKLKINKYPFQNQKQLFPQHNPVGRNFHSMKQFLTRRFKVGGDWTLVYVG